MDIQPFEICNIFPVNKLTEFCEELEVTLHAPALSVGRLMNYFQRNHPLLEICFYVPAI